MSDSANDTPLHGEAVAIVYAKLGVNDPKKVVEMGSFDTLIKSMLDQNQADQAEHAADIKITLEAESLKFTIEKKTCACKMETEPVRHD
jgi:hypothetical protein